MDLGLGIRDADAARDAARCAQIYAPFVERSAVSFEELAPTAEQLADRIAAAQHDHAWLVAERNDRVIGYAYGGRLRERPAYRWACEVSVYVDPDSHGRGVGRALYEGLLQRLRERGMRTACAGMTVPNAASEALHRAFGFEPVGTFRGVGRKFGRWHDVRWFQLDLAPTATDAATAAQASTATDAATAADVASTGAATATEVSSVHDRMRQ